MNDHAMRSQAVAAALENIKINMSLREFEQLLEGTVAAPEGERSEEWIALVAPGADEQTKRRLSAAHDSWARSVKSQAREPVSARLAALRKELAAQKLDGFLIPRADEHQGEYVPKRAERLAWISDFTGSAGLAIVLADKAAVFVDGRYTIQVREQVDAKLFEIRHVVTEPPEAWIAANLKTGAVLGFDPWLTTADAARRYREAARKAGAELKAVERNPLDEAWTDQPPEPIAPIWPQDTRHAGMSAADKRQLIAKKLREKGQDAAVISAPDSLAWLLNIRGGDVPRTPFALGYAIIDTGGRVDLFVDPRKLTQEARAHLGNEVAVQPKTGFLPALDALGKSGASVVVDAMTAGVAISDRLKAAGAKPAFDEDPCALPKACKNPVEVEGARAAHRRDGAAVSQFLHWLSIAAPKGGLDEIAAAEKLAAFRRQGDLFRDFSFDTISAAGPNGAICHYKVTEQSNRPIPVNSLYLVDSRPRYAEFTPDGKEVWVSSEIGGTVSVIDAGSREILKKIGFEIQGVRADTIQPVGVRITPDGKTAFVALGPANRVAVIDVASREVQDYLLVGQRVWQLDFTPDAKLLLSTNGESNDISVIDVAERKVIKSIPVGELPWGVAIR